MLFDVIRQDLRFALRSLARARSVAAVAIGSLAIGIAANATVFSLVQAVEFPRLIYPDAARIVVLESRNHPRNLSGMPLSAPDAADIASANRTLDLPSLTADQTSILRESTIARRIGGRRVMPTFFDVMRVPAATGRVLQSHDGQDSIVVSNRLWLSDFAGDQSIVGRAIRLDGGTVTVVGVMPAGFDVDADFWVPLTSVVKFARDDRQFTVFARLAPAASLDDAATELEAISRRLASDHSATNKDWSVVPIPMNRLHGRDSRATFFLLQAAVAFVLLIACANIANILLARGTSRGHEMAVRVSLGASRGRLLSGLLIESLLLALAGGGLGVLLAMWGIRLARALGGFPDVLSPTLNPIVLAFTVSLSMLTGVLCGILPALRASGVPPQSVLRAEDGRGTPAATRGWLRAGLVAAQIACALILATGATLMLRSLVNREQVNLGFDPRGAVRGDLSLQGNRYRDAAAIRAAISAMLDDLNGHPDVAAAGAVTWALPTAPGSQRQFTVPSADDRPLPGSVRRGVEAVTPRYFDALGASLTLGRVFTDADRDGAAPVAVVNEELVRHLWPNRNPIGETLRLGSPAEAAPTVTVIGVVTTIRRSGMHDQPIARVYVPFAQYPNASLSLVVRGRTDVAAASRELQTSVARVDRTLFVENLRTVDADVAQFLAPIRLVTSLLTGFGVVGLFLAGLGVFGAMSYMVSQRQREMAVRAALGAHQRDIVRLVFSSALRVTALGIIAGTMAALAGTRVLSSYLFGVSATDLPTFVAAIGFLVVVSLAACYRPARVAATSDPMQLLRG